MTSSDLTGQAQAKLGHKPTLPFLHLAKYSACALANRAVTKEVAQVKEQPQHFVQGLLP